MAYYLNVIQISALVPSVTLTLLCVLAALLFLRYFKAKKNNLPPGPFVLSFFGHTPFVSFHHKELVKIGEKYGDVFSLRQKGKTAIVINDLQPLKEAYNKPAFLGSGLESISDVLPDGAGLFELNGVPWQEQRRFFSKSLKEGGFAIDKISGHFKEGIQEYLDHLEKLNGHPTDFYNEVTVSLNNVILSMAIEQRFDYVHPTAKMLKKASENFVEFFTPDDLIQIPVIRKILSYFKRDPNYESKLQAFRDMNDFFRQLMQEHKSELDPNNPRDFIDYYLIEIENNKNNPETSFTEGMLVATVQMLFLLGIIDIRSSLYWIVLCLAEYQEVQRRIQDEIDDLMGRDRFPTWEDHSEMPFTEATIRETHRWKPSTPIGCIRRTLEDSSIGEYFIPKNSLIYTNFWWMMNNPVYWKDPEMFRPERHLSKDGKGLINHERYLPFSYGKRQCAGEKFAQMELFLYITAILQRFTIRMPEGKPVDLTEVIDINSHGRPQKICFIPR